MSKTFEGIYEVESGYAGRSRPQYFTIDADDLDDDMTDEELLELHEEFARAAFQQLITFRATNSKEFIAWAREQLTARKGEEGR